MDSKLLLIISALALAATSTFMYMDKTDASGLQSSFEAFKNKHGKLYATEEEEAYRFAVYVQNLAKIHKHNSEGHSWWMAENHMADLTHEEFRATYLGLKPKQTFGSVDEEYSPMNGDVDWTSQLNAVKDQGQCGSCWAFSAMGSSEGRSSIVAGNPLENFAEQQLVDCDTVDAGCNGGLMDQAFDYLKTDGFCLTSSYTYTSGGSGSGGSCKASSCSKSSVSLSTYTDCSGVSTLSAAVQDGPVSVAVDANNWSFYAGGIFNDCQTSLDHGVTLVGLTTDGVWKVRNSWAASWGESGYIRLKKGNTCGLANQPSYPAF